MEWNEALKAEAEAVALENVAICKETVPKSPYGWNVAGKQGKSDFRTVEDVMMIWENKLDGGFPKNSEFLQVLWSGTRYVGCADAVSPPGSEKTCTFSVCFYAKPGVCGMEKRFKGDWEKAVKEGPSCGDVCPPDMEECN